MGLKISWADVAQYSPFVLPIRGPPPTWRRPPGRPRQTWTRTIEADLRPLSIGLHTAWRRAQDRTTWNKLVRTATPCPAACYWWWWWWWWCAESAVKHQPTL